MITPSITLNGQQTFSTLRQPSREALIFISIFQPTGLFHLTGIPSHEFTNKILDAEMVFNKELSSLKEQLKNAKSYEEMIALADKFFIYLANRAKTNVYQVAKVSHLMLQKGGNISLDYLAKEAFLSTKQFKRKFYEQTGLNPKEYSRIIRFSNAYNTKNKNPHLDWLTVAYDCGYYDYQHLVKDYKDFTGLTPNAFHQIVGKDPENVLGVKFEDRAISNHFAD